MGWDYDEPDQETGVRSSGGECDRNCLLVQDVEPIVKPLEGQRVVCGEVHALFETKAEGILLRCERAPCSKLMADKFNNFFVEIGHNRNIIVRTNW